MSTHRKSKTSSQPKDTSWAANFWWEGEEISGAGEKAGGGSNLSSGNSGTAVHPLRPDDIAALNADSGPMWV